jgi:hypothetical protein
MESSLAEVVAQFLEKYFQVGLQAHGPQGDKKFLPPQNTLTEKVLD